MNKQMPSRHWLPAQLLALLLLAAGAAAAQDYEPDVIELDGSNSLAFDSAPQLALADGGTLEFWVAPGWQSDPGYDPVIVSYAGPEGAAYLVAMLAQRDGLVIAAGESEDYFAFDFSDSNLHHVAISQLEDGLVVMVDGQTLGVSDLMFADLPAESLWVGTINGQDDAFVGAIGAVRIWNAVIDAEELVAFALMDVFENDHPDIDNLSAVSDFTTRQLLLVDGVDDPQ